MSKPNILFLADTTHHTKAVIDHINAITTSRSINWHIINPLGCKIIDKLDFSKFDGVGLHYSIKPYNHYYLSKSLKIKIASYSGTKFLFLQDEYQKVNQVQEYLYALNFNLLFTLVNEKNFDLAYPDPRLSDLKKITVLTGYVQDYMKSIESLPVNKRTIDVSYRGRRCEYWLGSLAYEKELIVTEFLKYTAGKNLKLDISLDESSRVYGDAWFQLLMNSKAVLGTESGASIWDFDDRIRKKTNLYLSKHKHADFKSVYENVLKPYDGKIVYNAISPRVFEAAATKTPMIMFPGFYSGVCKPGTHYLVLEKDFSNIDEIIEKLRDDDYLQMVADRTYIDLIQSDLYSQHVLSELVASELLKHIKINSRIFTQRDIKSDIEEKVNKFKRINQFRCFHTELTFIIRSFFTILFDPKNRLVDKFNILTAGLKRYLAYLLPRLKRGESRN